MASLMLPSPRATSWVAWPTGLLTERMAVMAVVDVPNTTETTEVRHWLPDQL